MGTVIAALVAILIGLVLSPLPRRYPIFSWITLLFPSLTGLLPALTPQPWAYTADRLQSLDLRGQTALITGANSGIGLEIARALSHRGASVTMACRNPQRCFAAADELRRADDYPGSSLSPLVMDVSDLKSVERAAGLYLKHNGGPLDMLFLNAGVAHVEPEGGAGLPTSKDGVETVFATNVLGHHFLYRLLEPALLKSSMARVVSTSSVASMWWLTSYALPYLGSEPVSLLPTSLAGINDGEPSLAKTLQLYGRSKLAQVTWTKALAKRLGDESNIYVNAAHPGAVFTPIFYKDFERRCPRFAADALLRFVRRLLWTTEEGALTGLYLGVVTDDLRNMQLRGRYFHPQAMEMDHPYAAGKELQENVWRLCEDLVESFRRRQR